MVSRDQLFGAVDRRVVTDIEDGGFNNFALLQRDEDYLKLKETFSLFSALSLTHHQKHLHLHRRQIMIYYGIFSALFHFR